MAQGTINTPREQTHQRIADALEDIVDKIVDTSSASNIDYDNTQSGLSANKVQGAVDELASEKADKSTTLAGYGITDAYTKAEVNDALNTNTETIAEAIKQWDTGSYTIDLYGIGLPETYYTASSTYSGDKYLDVATGKMYDCLQTGADTYTWRQAPVVLQLKSDINASAIEDIQEDISQSLTATGNPLTIEASESNLVECKAEVEAYQDLHGYDHPWVGGAGKNKLPMTVANIKSANTSGTWSGNAYTVNGVTVTIETDNDGNVIGIKANGTPSTITYVLIGKINLNANTTYRMTGCPSNPPTDDILYVSNQPSGFGNWIDSGSGQNYTASQNWSGISIYLRLGAGSVHSNTIFKPMIATDTSTTYSDFEPYSNISPITGQTEVVIEDVGKNLFNGKNSGYEILSDGTLGINNDIVTSDYIPVIQGNYYLTNVIGSAISRACAVYDSNKSFVRIVTFPGNNTASGTITIESDEAYIRCACSASYKDSCQVEKGNTATTYEPYQGKTYTIQLGDTIYGGELDVLTGELTVTHGYAEFDGSSDEGWTSNPTSTSNVVRMALFDAMSDCKNPPNNSTNIGFVTNQYVSLSANDTYVSTEGISLQSGQKFIAIYDERFNTSDSINSFKSWLASNPLQVVYPLATPYTIQLTPQQIRLLKGTSHLSCNTGDLSIKYYPDNVLGQLKGDIEDEYDERVETLESQMLGRPELKSLTITNKLTSNDGVAVINELSKAIIVGAYLYNADDNDNAVVAIPYLAVSGRLPFLKICRDSTTLSLLAGVHISGIIYYFEI